MRTPDVFNMGSPSIKPGRKSVHFSSEHPPSSKSQGRSSPPHPNSAVVQLVMGVLRRERNEVSEQALEGRPDLHEFGAKHLCQRILFHPSTSDWRTPFVVRCPPSRNSPALIPKASSCKLCLDGGLDPPRLQDGALQLPHQNVASTLLWRRAEIHPQSLLPQAPWARLPLSAHLLPALDGPPKSLLPLGFRLACSSISPSRTRNKEFAHVQVKA